MVRCHWDINAFEHYGSGDFGMLGWDALKDPNQLQLFQFGEIERDQLRKQLLNSMPREFFKLASSNWHLKTQLQ